MSTTLGIEPSTTSSKASAALTVSPIWRMSAWGMVPMGFSPMSRALATVATPSQPPMKAARSTIGTIDGCTRRAPKVMSPLSPQATLHREALVAMPEAWHRHPRMAVSSLPKAR
ncbi:MAG: hypothetical protein BWX71_02411 [Deltaproteobacteria bacterium ADurb.Bin072]|nr:MAG: hypothetical protein BWX71_02411 [Deltaproteobacteria bacterium ADurb.Bin072]